MRQDTQDTAVADSPRLDLDLLSNREKEVLALLGRGRSRGQIAQELFRSTKTIDNHCTRIYSKLGVRSQAQLVNLLHEQGLIEGGGKGVGAAGLDDLPTIEDRVWEALVSIEKRLAQAPEDRFFAVMLAGLADAVGTSLAGLSEVDSSTGEITAIGVIDRGDTDEQMTYGLDNSACGQAYRLGQFTCERGAKSLFPEAEPIRLKNIDSYSGIRLEMGSIGRIGCLWVADRSPMMDVEFVEGVLRVLRRRVSSELALQIAVDRLDALG